jgi:hypothetical protein
MFQECVLETASRHLIFHGALVLLVALLYGALYAFAISTPLAAISLVFAAAMSL